MLTVIENAAFMAVGISNAATASAKKGGIILAGEVTQDLHQLIISLKTLSLGPGGSQGHPGARYAVPDGLMEVLDDKLLQFVELGSEGCLHV